jgi:hypothetical protein
MIYITIRIIFFFLSAFLALGSFAGTKTVALGDLEGNYDKLVSFLHNSEAFTRDHNDEWSLKNGYKFVFLGDAVDKAPGNIRVIRTLLNLKKLNPENVTLILGNRDISKMTMYNYMNMSFEDVFKTLSRSYRSVFVTENIASFSDLESEQNLKKLAKSLDSKVLRLKTLYHIMNTGGGFEHIKNELTFLHPNRVITDQSVVEHFYKDVRPGGAHFEYLQNAQLIHRIDNTIYLHGALSNEAFGYVPGIKNKNLNPNLWIRDLNDWAQKQILSWGDNTNAGSALIDYSTPKKPTSHNVSSVMYNRFSDAHGNVKAPPRKVRTVLEIHGISRIVVGHTPVEQYPIVAKFENIEVVLSDVSSAKGTRASVITIEKNSVKVQSYSVNGHSVVTQVANNRAILPDGLIIKSGFRVVGKDEVLNKYILIKVSGSGREFKNKYINLSLDEIIKIGFRGKTKANICELIFSY